MSELHAGRVPAAVRECWVNVYPSPGLGGFHLGAECASRGAADFAALGDDKPWNDGPAVSKALRTAGVGYRLHVRLKGDA